MSVIGYCDPLRGRPGDRIGFMISSAGDRLFRAHVVRIIHADPNPAGPGMKLLPVATIPEQRVAGREQIARIGSCLRAPCPDLRAQRPFHLVFNLRILRVVTGPAVCLVNLQSPDGRDALGVFLEGNSLIVRRRDGGQLRDIASRQTIHPRRWHTVALQLYPATGDASLASRDLARRGAASVEPLSLGEDLRPDRWADVSIGAAWAGYPTACFTGQIERPSLVAGPLPDLAALGGALGVAAGESLACWDFSWDIDTQGVRDLGPAGLDGELVNLPMRAVRGSNWSGREMHWRQAPQEYGAIHFHADDVGDLQWEESLAITLPQDLPSGIYALVVDNGAGSDTIPFFVLPARGAAKAPIAYLASTLTYVAYANHRRGNVDNSFRQRMAAWQAYPRNPDQVGDYGFSTYNYHPDGSGIALSSRRRPILTMRPGFLTFNDKAGSGLRHFPADTHLVDWLTVKGFAFDVITDEDLDEDGAALLEGYKVLITGSHPEYHTERMLDALKTFRQQGGNFMYMGGNGFYWRIARRHDLPHVIEVRRAESGIRAWASEPGEYYHQLDGSYGGLWRRNGRPPQALAEVGFSVQGLFEGAGYRRTPASYDASVSWIFEGLDPGATFGAFGLSGGGSAGFELDQVSPLLGTDEGTVVLAMSEGHGPDFKGVPEDILTHTLSVGEPIEIRAHMVYGCNAAGSEVFATGSITFLGSLSHGNYDNAVSTILDNVLRRFTR